MIRCFLFETVDFPCDLHKIELAYMAVTFYFTDGEYFNSQSYNFSGEKNNNQGFLICKYFDQMIYTRSHFN